MPNVEKDAGLTGFTRSERAADMDGSLTVEKIDRELRSMAGLERVRVILPPVTWYDGDKPVSEVTTIRDRWTGSAWADTSVTPSAKGNS